MRLEALTKDTDSLALRHLALICICRLLEVQREEHAAVLESDLRGSTKISEANQISLNSLKCGQLLSIKDDGSPCSHAVACRQYMCSFNKDRYIALARILLLRPALALSHDAD